MDAERRLVIASNRLPITAEIVDGDVVLTEASGGLATGLRSWHERSAGVWIGWPGLTSRLSTRQRAALDRQLETRRIVPVHLTRHEVRRYYDDFSNGVLWPVFHYLLDRLPLGPSTWDSYRSVNERFAEQIAHAHQPGDLIWVHDYQLMLVPGLLRRRLPDARVGFFLHIPFPASEIFRTLPWRREILEGLIGADLIGFHTYSYVQHFSSAVSEVLGLEVENGRVWFEDRETRVGVFPMGVDAAAFDQLARSPSVEEEVQRMRHDAGDRTILLGVDRLDYTKGIRRRLLAIEALLREDRDLCGRIQLIQVAVPSRDNVPSYQEFRREIEGLIGRINGTYATVAFAPVHYLHQSVSREQLVALYRAADVMLVTPLRDGMNLVAKEFVASRADEDGVLVLSEFAGAAEELHEALYVNAYDVQSLAVGIREALHLGRGDRAVRMRAMRRRVMARDVHRWVSDFVRALEREPGLDVRPTPEATLAEALRHARAATTLALLLDYDGTLVPITATPERAAPDESVLALVAHLAARPNTYVHLISGRGRDVLDDWFGKLPIVLWAEHGTWRRPHDATDWVPTLNVSDTAWLAEARSIVEEFVGQTPGSFLEEKTAAVAWHYRQALRGFGEAQARELRIALSRAMVDRPVEITEGKKVLEVRPRGAGKGAIVKWLLAHEPAPTLILACGDDRTDEEMFAMLPSDAITIRVGPGGTSAKHRLRDVAATRAFLAALLE
jgi:trehalose 6-phosphate synthase/phosphatase